MKRIKPEERRVANIQTAEYVASDPEATTERGISILQLNPARPNGVGFYI